MADVGYRRLYMQPAIESVVHLVLLRHAENDGVRLFALNCYRLIFLLRGEPAPGAGCVGGKRCGLSDGMNAPTNADAVGTVSLWRLGAGADADQRGPGFRDTPRQRRPRRRLGIV